MSISNQVNTIYQRFLQEQRETKYLISNLLTYLHMFKGKLYKLLRSFYVTLTVYFHRNTYRNWSSIATWTMEGSDISLSDVTTSTIRKKLTLL